MFRVGRIKQLTVCRELVRESPKPNKTLVARVLRTPYPEVKVTATHGGRALPEDFIKVGGTPKSIQGGSPPICPQCNNDMAFLVQIGSLPTPLRNEVPDLEPFIFMDMGNVYLYACQNCTTFEATMDCF